MGIFSGSSDHMYIKQNNYNVHTTPNRQIVCSTLERMFLKWPFISSHMVVLDRAVCTLPQQSFA